VVAGLNGPFVFANGPSRRARSIAQHFIFRQFRQEKRFRVAWHGTAVDDVRPQIDGRRCDEGGAQRHDLEIVVQVLALTTIERPTGGARVAPSVMANASKITSGFIGKENVGAEIYLLRAPFKAPANPGKRGKICLTRVLLRSSWTKTDI
jgi:hypothetical protein